MANTIEMAPQGAIRAAIARAAYDRDEIRVADPAIADCEWLFATQRGVFGISGTSVRTVIHGWFFGLRRHEDHLYLFENCGFRDRTVNLGRVIRFDIAGGRLTGGTVLLRALHTNCHQVAVIDGMLHVVDTNNQVIRRFTLAGEPIDICRPFPPAPATDTSGAYMHINSIAKIGDRIALMLHNGNAIPKKNSELAWLDSKWNPIERVPVAGHMCHDILEDEEGRLWHSASESGEIMRSDGLRLRITDTMMTRGIARAGGMMAVGTCTFGPRHLRGTLNGAVVLLDDAGAIRARIDVPGGPTDIIAL